MATEPPSGGTWHVTPAPVRAGGIVLALTALVVIICLAFAWPAARSKPHDLPIGVAGTLTAQQLQSRLDQITPGGFAVTGYPDQAALRAAILHRAVYGGLAVNSQGTALLTASGASPVVAQLLTQAGVGVTAHTGTPLHIEDLAPLPLRDPRGSGLAAAALPVTVAGLLPAIVLLLAFPGAIRLQFVATVLFSMLTALTVASLLWHIFGSVDDNFWGVSAGLTLGILAMSLPALGLGELFGRLGVAAAAVLAVLLGDPLSGVMTAPPLLPHGWATVGQLLPQGANGTLLRSTAYFSGAGGVTATVVLAGWAAAGALLIGIAGLRSRT